MKNKHNKLDFHGIISGGGQVSSRLNGSFDCVCLPTVRLDIGGGSMEDRLVWNVSFLCLPCVSVCLRLFRWLPPSLNRPP